MCFVSFFICGVLFINSTSGAALRFTKRCSVSVYLMLKICYTIYEKKRSTCMNRIIMNEGGLWGIEHS